MNNADYMLLNYISQNYALIVDTREKLTTRYKERMESFERMGVVSERQPLNVGDYSAIADLPGGYIDYTRKIAIERKRDLKELISCFGTERERFEKELQRAQECGCKLYIVTEGGSYSDIVAGNYENNHSVKNALATYHTFEQRYGCSFVFVTPEDFPVFAHETFRRYIMDDLTARYYNGTLTKFMT